MLEKEDLVALSVLAFYTTTLGWKPSFLHKVLWEAASLLKKYKEIREVKGSLEGIIRDLKKAEEILERAKEEGCIGFLEQAIFRLESKLQKLEPLTSWLDGIKGSKEDREMGLTSLKETRENLKSLLERISEKLREAVNPEALEEDLKREKALAEKLIEAGGDPEAYLAYVRELEAELQEKKRVYEEAKSMLPRMAEELLGAVKNLEENLKQALKWVQGEAEEIKKRVTGILKPFHLENVHILLDDYQMRILSDLIVEIVETHKKILFESIADFSSIMFKVYSNRKLDEAHGIVELIFTLIPLYLRGYRLVNLTAEAKNLYKVYVSRKAKGIRRLPREEDLRGLEELLLEALKAVVTGIFLNSWKTKKVFSVTENILNDLFESLDEEFTCSSPIVDALLSIIREVFLVEPEEELSCYKLFAMPLIYTLLEESIKVINHIAFPVLKETVGKVIGLVSKEVKKARNTKKANISSIILDVEAREGEKLEEELKEKLEALLKTRIILFIPAGLGEKKEQKRGEEKAEKP